jgi:hypothetical protein
MQQIYIFGIIKQFVIKKISNTNLKFQLLYEKFLKYTEMQDFQKFVLKITCKIKDFENTNHSTLTDSLLAFTQ